MVFQAGTKLSGESPESVVTSGGRVLTVVGWGDNRADASSNAYRRLELIHFDGCYYRSDIGRTDIGEITSPVEKGAWLANPVPQRL